MSLSGRLRKQKGKEVHNDKKDNYFLDRLCSSLRSRAHVAQKDAMAPSSSKANESRGSLHAGTRRLFLKNFLPGAAFCPRQFF